MQQMVLRQLDIYRQKNEIVLPQHHMQKLFIKLKVRTKIMKLLEETKKSKYFVTMGYIAVLDIIRKESGTKEITDQLNGFVKIKTSVPQIIPSRK